MTESPTQPRRPLLRRVLIASAVSCCVLGVWAVALWRWAPQWWPRATMRWAPSADMAMRALIVEMSVHPQGLDERSIADATARFPAADLAALVDARDSRSARAIMFLSFRADAAASGRHRDPEALRCAAAMVRHPDPWVRVGMLRWLTADTGGTAEIVLAAIDDDHAQVAMSAAGRLAALRPEERPPLPADAIERVRRACGRTFAAPTEDVALDVAPAWLLAIDAPAQVPPLTTPEAERAVARARSAIWAAWAALDPAAAAQALLAGAEPPTSDGLSPLGAMVRAGADGIVALASVARRQPQRAAEACRFIEEAAAAEPVPSGAAALALLSLASGATAADAERVLGSLATDRRWHHHLIAAIEGAADARVRAELLVRLAALPAIADLDRGPALRAAGLRLLGDADPARRADGVRVLRLAGDAAALDALAAHLRGERAPAVRAAIEAALRAAPVGAAIR